MSTSVVDAVIVGWTFAPFTLLHEHISDQIIRAG